MAGIHGYTTRAERPHQSVNDLGAGYFRKREWLNYLNTPDIFGSSQGSIHVGVQNNVKNLTFYLGSCQ